MQELQRQKELLEITEKIEISKARSKELSRHEDDGENSEIHDPKPNLANVKGQLETPQMHTKIESQVNRSRTESEHREHIM